MGLCLDRRGDQCGWRRASEGELEEVGRAVMQHQTVGPRLHGKGFNSPGVQKPRML